jgi:hypothetical protein
MERDERGDQTGSLVAWVRWASLQEHGVTRGRPMGIRPQLGFRRRANGGRVGSERSKVAVVSWINHLMPAGMGSSISVSRDTLARFFGKNKLFVKKACTYDIISNPQTLACAECNESPGEWNAKLGGIRLSLLCVRCERGKTDEPVSLERSQLA